MTASPTWAHRAAAPFMQIVPEPGDPATQYVSIRLALFKFTTWTFSPGRMSATLSRSSSMVMEPSYRRFASVTMAR